jgi:hypothetical protein
MAAEQGEVAAEVIVGAEDWLAVRQTSS